MSIELVMFKRDIHGNKLPQKTSIRSLDGEDVSYFWKKYKRGSSKPKDKPKKPHGE